MKLVCPCLCALSAVVLVLGACAPRPALIVDPPRFLGPPVPAPGYGRGGVPVDLTAGFNETEPDTCKAAGLQGMVGQSAGNLRTVPLAGAVRIIPPGALVTQEYDAHRIDVNVDRAGNILRIQCG